MPFGRSGDAQGDLTDIGCPDCRGVLAVREDVKRRHLAFSCRVGHAYSGESLIAAKEDQLEESLWSAVEVYEEIAQLHGEMAARARADGLTSVAAAYQRRSRRALALKTVLRKVLIRDAPATADKVKR